MNHKYKKDKDYKNLMFYIRRRGQNVIKKIKVVI